MLGGDKDDADRGRTARNGIKVKRKRGMECKGMATSAAAAAEEYNFAETVSKGLIFCRGEGLTSSGD